MRVEDKLLMAIQLINVFDSFRIFFTLVTRQPADLVPTNTKIGHDQEV